jgi:hypothetical protein
LDVLPADSWYLDYFLGQENAAGSEIGAFGLSNRRPEGVSTCVGRRRRLEGDISVRAYLVLPLRNSWISSCTTFVAIHLDVLDQLAFIVYAELSKSTIKITSFQVCLFVPIIMQAKQVQRASVE